MKRYKLDEEKYTKALKEFAKQLVAMAQEDCTDEDTRELDEDGVYELACEYLGDAHLEINEEFERLIG